MSADMGSDHEEKRRKKSKRKHRHEEEGDKMDVDEEPKATETPKKEKKKHKEKKRKERTEDAEAEHVEAQPVASPEKKHKKHKSTDKKEKKSKHHKSAATPEKPAERNDEPYEAVVPDPNEYPFFTQTFSQRIPVWPAAFDEPITKMAREYLDPMLNRYSPKFRGVLLAYKNVNLSNQPERANPENPPTDDTPVVLESVECYAPPFAWLTADLHLFIPSRGAWMEGVINLQSEGHIGVVCFDKFNASISRRSLPRGWTWVEQPEDEVEEEPEQAAEEDPFIEGQESGEGEEAKEAKEVPQLRSSGHWLDHNGDKVTGKIYFRIKNFSSGSTGDYTYLSLQGTMLDDEAERESVAEEKAIEKARRARQSPGGLLYPTMRLPEFSMTKLKDESI